VFVARIDGMPVINKIEAEDWKFVDLQQLLNKIEENPDEYTHWFKSMMADKYSDGNLDQ
jgi:isopentenyl-diphosphate delta-isomerase